MTKTTWYCTFVFVLSAGLVATGAKSVLGQTSGQPKSINKSDPAAVITSILEEQAAAWNRGDLEAFMSGYWKSDKLTFSSGGKVTRGWQATLDRYRTRYSTKSLMGTLKFDKLEIRPIGKDAALVLGNWHLTRDSGDMEGNFTLVFVRQDDEWRIVHDHSSQLEED